MIVDKPKINKQLELLIKSVASRLWVLSHLDTLGKELVQEKKELKELNKTLMAMKRESDLGRGVLIFCYANWYRPRYHVNGKVTLEIGI